ncbi:MAG: hypothetical protein WC734_03095 [Patescibacteria group bacterium]
MGKFTCVVAAIGTVCAWALAYIWHTNVPLGPWPEVHKFVVGFYITVSPAMFWGSVIADARTRRHPVACVANTAR